MEQLVPYIGHDKKNDADGLQIILLKSIGEAYRYRAELDFFDQLGKED